MFRKIKEVADTLQPDRNPSPQPELSIVERLRAKRTQKVRQANDLDAEIATLDQEISWMERHPFGALIIEKFYHEAKHDIS